MGENTARKLVGYNILEIFGDSDMLEISEMEPLTDWIGKTIKEADIRRNHGINVLAIYRKNHLMVTISPDCVINKDDIIVVLSEKKANF